MSDQASSHCNHVLFQNSAVVKYEKLFIQTKNVLPVGFQIFIDQL